MTGLEFSGSTGFHMSKHWTSVATPNLQKLLEWKYWRNVKLRWWKLLASLVICTYYWDLERELEETVALNVEQMNLQTHWIILMYVSTFIMSPSLQSFLKPRTSVFGLRRPRPAAYRGRGAQHSSLFGYIWKLPSSFTTWHQHQSEHFDCYLRFTGASEFRLISISKSSGITPAHLEIAETVFPSDKSNECSFGCIFFFP